MAIAFDAFTSSTGGTGDYSFSHTPVGTPKGVIVYVIFNGAAIGISGVTYGGVAMAEQANSPASNLTGELGASHCFFLGASIPSGMQTVAIDVTLGTEVSVAGCVTVTAANDTSVVTTGKVESNSQANPAVTLSLGGVSSFCMLGAWDGIGTVIAPFTDWTERFEHDFGNQLGYIATYNVIGTTDVSAGYTRGADDVALHAIAVRESAGGATTVKTLAALGVG